MTHQYEYFKQKHDIIEITKPSGGFKVKPHINLTNKSNFSIRGN